MADKSRDGLLEFLDWAESKGLLAKGTAQSRKATANSVLSILSDEEASDVTRLDIEELMSRFQNLEGKRFTPTSLRTYKSRLISTMEDFRSYLNDPMSFRPNVQSRKRKLKLKKRATVNESEAEPERSNAGSNNYTSNNPTPPASTGVIPIPIRSDRTIFIHGVPFDLKPAEARRIANVINALAIDEDCNF